MSRPSFLLILNVVSPLSATMDWNNAMKLIHSWEPASDVLGIKNGKTLLLLASTIPSIIVTNRVRHVLKMRNYGALSSYAGTMFIPAACASLLHFRFVTVPLVEGAEQCAFCLETRSGIIQAAVSVLHPMILSPLVVLPFAQRYMTYPVPAVNDYREIFKLLKQMYQPVTKKFVSLAIIQFMIGVVVAEWQIRDMRNIVNKIELMEQALKTNLSPQQIELLKRKAQLED